jgi:malonyl-CoA O-methyltransferase
VASGFATPVMDAEVLTLTYPASRELLREVRALGGNPRDDRAPALPPGRQARSLLDALGARRGDDGRIRLTFEVAYGHAWKPAMRSAAGASVSVDSLRTDLARRRQARPGV